MCTQKYHHELGLDWQRFEDETEAGFIQGCAGFFWEARHCRRCHSSLPHPRDLALYGLAAQPSMSR
jgi:hypothetical protein